MFVHGNHLKYYMMMFIFCYFDYTIYGDCMKVLITGATSGIAYSLARELFKRCHIVYICVHCNNEVKLVRRKLKKDNIYKNVYVFKMDITNKKDINLIDKLDIDVLVNHAGIGIGGSLLDLDIKDIRYNFETNFFSTLELTKRFIDKKKKEDKRGRVLITSSLAGLMPIPFLGSYCASKSALITMGICLDKELKRSSSKIDIKLILPGAYKTGFNQVMLESLSKSISNSDYFVFEDDLVLDEKRFFNVVESLDISSIVYKMADAIESNSNKLLYKAPFSQGIFTKIYMLFK